MIRRLYLHNFRNFTERDLNIGREFAVLTGSNGTGKTNILESLSLLSPGQGLRRAQFSEMACTKAHDGWAAAATMMDGSVIGTSWEPGGKRRIRINETPSGSTELLRCLRVLWLTPEHDRLFADAPAVRRKFLDRMVYQVYPDHLPELMAFEQALRQRAALLKEPAPDSRWLHALECRLAALTPSIAARRIAVLDRIGSIEPEVLCGFRPVYTGGQDGEDDPKRWEQARAEDIRRRMATLGAGRHDWTAVLTHKDREAAGCSTGEQKLLLFAVLFSFLHAYPFPQPTLLLLDDIVSHLDARRRSMVLEALTDLENVQVWMTGTDTAAFIGLPAEKTCFIETDPFVS